MRGVTCQELSMGYELHIVRNEQWWEENVGGGVAIEEWSQYVSTDSSMRLDNIAQTGPAGGPVIEYENEGLAVWTGYSAHNEAGNKAWFDFRDGCIIVKNPDEEIRRKMHEIAEQLNAKVLGDEGEEYGADGECLPSDGDGMLTEHKPWWRFW